jgi:hypothetical protein
MLLHVTSATHVSLIAATIVHLGTRIAYALTMTITRCNRMKKYANAVTTTIILAAISLPPANATLLYDTAGTYHINTAVNDNVLIENREANVVVGSGGVIRGVESTGTAFPGAVKTRLGSLEVADNGRIIAGVNQNAINMTGGGSVVRLRDHASITGDIVSALPALTDEATALGRLYIQDHAVVNGNLIYGSFVRIQDQALILGDVRGYGNTNVNLDMRGGTVAGALQLGGLDDHRVTMSGGSILGGFRGAPSYVEMMMTGGYIGDGFRTIGHLDANFRGGQFDGGISVRPVASGASQLSITGGVFDTYIGDWLLEFADTHLYSSSGRFSTLDIFGGQFGYANAGNGLFVDEWTNFNIYGRDLVYSNGWLTGYLEDGNWFSNQLTFGGNWRGTFTIHNVPEPSTWLLLAACLTAMGFARRQR